MSTEIATHLAKIADRDTWNRPPESRGEWLSRLDALGADDPQDILDYATEMGSAGGLAVYAVQLDPGVHVLAANGWDAVWSPNESQCGGGEWLGHGPEPTCTNCSRSIETLDGRLVHSASLLEVCRIGRVYGPNNVATRPKGSQFGNLLFSKSQGVRLAIAIVEAASRVQSDALASARLEGAVQALRDAADDDASEPDRHWPSWLYARAAAIKAGEDLLTEKAPGCPVVHGGEEWSALDGGVS